MFEVIKAVPVKLTLILLALASLVGWILFQAGKHEARMSGAPSSQFIANAVASDKKASTGNIPPGNILTVQGSQISAQTIVGGTIIPARDVTLTAQLSGQVRYLAGREGDRFTQNTLLVGINADQLQAKRQASVALLNNAQSAINSAQVEYQREVLSPKSQSLSRSGGMGLPLMFDQMFTRPMSNFMPGNIGGDTILDRNADLHAVSTLLNQAQGRYMQIKSQIDEIDAQIADSRVNTPFPGIILEKMVETGDTIQVGAPLLRYADLSQLQIEAQVPASIVARLSKNMIIPIRLGDAEYESNARVEQIFPTADARRRTVTVKFDLPNNSRAIPGMYVELFLPGNQNLQEAVPVVPVAAVMFNGSLPTVNVLGANDELQLRMIRLGERLPNDNVAVVSGLRIGERILSRP
jgi:multidrug efflux pump subunit AcrA (membrane-fusion protein)